MKEIKTEQMYTPVIIHTNQSCTLKNATHNSFCIKLYVNNLLGTGKKCLYCALFLQMDAL